MKQSNGNGDGDGGTPRNITLLGVEHTQAIQYWNCPQGQGSAYAPPNSIPLTSQKRTLLRVYVDVGQATDKFPRPSRITGSLKIVGPTGVFNYVPINSTIAAKSLASIKRGNLNDTLNFFLPASICTGALQCTLKVYDPSRSNNYDGNSFTLVFEDIEPLAIHGVLIHYVGPDFFDKPVDAQPTGFDLLVTLDYVLRTFPISGFMYDGCEVLKWTSKLAISQNFTDLYWKLEAMRHMSGTNDVYIGLLPPAAGCGGLCGLGGDLTALYFANDTEGASHEIGHALGRQHAMCKNGSSNPDPTYPTYNGYPQGSIGEYGVDLGKLIVFDPSTTCDFMSYCPPRWVSPHTYLGIRNYVRTSLAATRFKLVSQPASAWGAESAEFFYLAFRAYRGGAGVEITSAFNIERQPPVSPSGALSEVSVELFTDDMRLIDVQGCKMLEDHLEPGAPFADYSATFPWSSEVKVLQLVRNGEVFATLRPEAEAPKVEITGIERTQQSRNKETIKLRWHGDAKPSANPHLEYGVRYSHDGGSCWRALATGLKQTEYAVDLSLLPGGEDCRLQVVASAGLRTTIAETNPFTVNRKARKPFVLSPKTGDEFEFGDPIELTGTAFSPDLGIAPFEEVVWASNSTGTIGIGYQITALDLPIGYHRITMHAPDGFGREATAAIGIRVIPRKCCNHDADSPVSRQATVRRCRHCGHHVS